MNMPIVQRIEICFWDHAIPLLSQSAFVRRLVKEASQLASRKDVVSGIALISSGGLAGLLLGILVPLVLHTAR